ncbi:MAG: pyruvate dehydrogenase (acetyl-transferring), homodimeric type [Kangiellaceae bacterium]|nr:pyruvate dehydrogenase (acetyl-transferring), homodimeric type [Kangiellaceae bacterium]
MTETTTNDIDPIETQEWLEALGTLVEFDGVERASYVLKEVIKNARDTGVDLPMGINTPYVNTIAPEDEPHYPGDHKLESKIRSIVRWNAMAMVQQAGKTGLDLGGHIASFASSNMLYDVGFNHFFKATDENQEGDLVYFQGHVSPGIYARAYVEGRLNEEQLAHFRQEVEGKGLSSYPHPWLMPDFWQFPTVSMGIGPLTAIYQARFLKYLDNRGVKDTKGRKVWAFLGDGECDEPESLGAISLASREKLDNLIFVINCNLQRLDGPVRGNGKIVQELEGVFRGAGWNVIKVLWGSDWDPLFIKDKSGKLVKRMDEAVDGEYQNYKAQSGAYTREHFFGKYPELKELVSDLTDDDIWALKRGGHDPLKVYAAYNQAVNHTGQPTVILAHTVKGYGMGDAAEGKNIAHQVKKLDVEQVRHYRDSINAPISDEDLEKAPFFRPADDSPEMQYLHEKRKALGGYLPKRRAKSESLNVPALDKFAQITKGTGEREASTTMGFVRILNTLVKDKEIGKFVVPIVPDEARTFGMEGMFRQVGIYSSAGQNYEPVDSGELMFYKEDIKGQILEEGINEAGAVSSWIAAATSYSNSDQPMIPFYIYYSMFGFQRIGDFAWAAGDSRARGFLLGATAGRTTLNGEGLQHEDGHSHILAGTIPNCVSYDPTYNYELAVIIQDGMRRMYNEQEDVFYYITLMNENYRHPEMPEGCEEGIIKGMYPLKSVDAEKALKERVTLLGSGTILREVEAAAELLASEWNVASDIWSVTSFNELRREAQEVNRQNFLNPEAPQKLSYVGECLKDINGPVIASTDYMANYADQIREYIPTTYKVLGTDGFGRSDGRARLRHHFEVDRYYVTINALKALADQGAIKPKLVTEAIKKYNIDVNKLNPLKA